METENRGIRYYKNHREECIERAKNYYQEHKTDYSEYNKKYYEENIKPYRVPKVRKPRTVKPKVPRPKVLVKKSKLPKEYFNYEKSLEPQKSIVQKQIEESNLRIASHYVSKLEKICPQGFYERKDDNPFQISFQ